MKRVSKVIVSAKEQQKAYMKHQQIWTESRTEFMYYFLRYGRYLTADELAMLEEDEESIKKDEPSLEDFKGHIDHYEGLHEELKGMEHSKTWQVCRFQVLFIAFILLLCTINCFFLICLLQTFVNLLF